MCRVLFKHLLQRASTKRRLGPDLQGHVCCAVQASDSNVFPKIPKLIGQQFD